MTRPALAPGEILADKFRLISQLGSGGMGEVWRAEHLLLRSEVAIKLILEAGFNEQLVQRFNREAQAAAALRSPHVVQILDYGVDPRGIPFMVMELLQGESLAALIRRQGRLAPVEVARIISQVCRAVGKAHEMGVVHRDLKPENIFLTYVDDEIIAKVLDFGIAKFQNPVGEIADASTRTGALVGTPYYMSPEQAEGRGKIDARSDLWALGVIAFECLAGQRPFVSDALGELLVMIMVRPIPVPSQIAPVPPGFDPWFARAVSRLPEGRFATARELADSLNQVCGLTGGTIRQALPLGAVPEQSGSLPMAAYASGEIPQPPMAHTAEPFANTVSPKKTGRGALVAGLVAAATLLAIVLGIGGVVLVRSLTAKKAPAPASSEIEAAQAAAGPPPTEAAPSLPPAESAAPPTASAEPAPSANAEKAREPTKSAAATQASTKTTSKTTEKTATEPKKTTGGKSPTRADDMY